MKTSKIAIQTVIIAISLWTIYQLTYFIQWLLGEIITSHELDVTGIASAYLIVFPLTVMLYFFSKYITYKHKLIDLFIHFFAIVPFILWIISNIRVYYAYEQLTSTYIMDIMLIISWIIAFLTVNKYVGYIKGSAITILFIILHFAIMFGTTPIN